MICREMAYLIGTISATSAPPKLSCHDTVVEKIERMYEEVGGFGHLPLFCFDYSDNPGAWHHSMELLAKEVMPKVAHLLPQPAVG